MCGERSCGIGIIVLHLLLRRENYFATLANFCKGKYAETTLHLALSLHFPATIMRNVRQLLSLALISSLLASASPALAFIDTGALEKNLESIEKGLSDPTGLNSLVDELQQAAGNAAGDYLQVTVDGQATTMWDVKKTDWFYAHVLALAELGIVSGYKGSNGKPTGKYGPGDNVTREQALKISLNSAGVVTANCTGEPASTKVSDWAKPFAVCAASMNFGIKAGADLKAPATRAEVLHYLVMAFRAQVAEGTPPFSDSKNHAYKNDIAFAYALGIISGDKNADGSAKGTFRPDANVNRAEVAKMAKLGIELL